MAIPLHIQLSCNNAKRKRERERKERKKEGRGLRERGR